jgi:hypothetical protein
MRVSGGYIQKQAVVSYSGQDFYVHVPYAMTWDPTLRACVTRGTINVNGCQYWVLQYMRPMLANGNYVYGMQNPTKLYPGSCTYNGTSDRHWTVIPR